MWLDYKPTRYEGKGFLHRDITGDRCGLGWIFFLNYSPILLNSSFANSELRFFNILYCSKAEALSFEKT